MLLSILPLLVLSLSPVLGLADVALPAAIRGDLATRDPSTYQIHPLDGPSIRDLQRMFSKRTSADGSQYNCLQKQCIALTFDDGPYLHHTTIDNILLSNNITGTYMMNGNNYRCIYDEAQVKDVKHSFNRGIQVAGHSWSHPNFTTFGNDTDTIDRQIELLETALWRIAGVVPRFMRMPYGEGTESQIEYINEKHQLIVVNWSVDTGDSAGYTTEQSLDVYRALKPTDRAMPLQHETYDNDVDILTGAIPILFKNGFKTSHFKSLADAFKVSPYKITGTPGTRNSSWTCDGTPAPGVG